MQGLLEAIERVAASQLVPTLERDFSELVDRVHRVYLRHALGADQTAERISGEDLAQLRRLALYLEAETTIDRPQDDQAVQDGLYVAATIFEFLGQYEGTTREGTPQGIGLPQRLATGDLADYTRAMVLYSLGRHESNGAVIGRRLLNAAVDTTIRAALDEAAVVAGLRVIVKLVSRDLRGALRAGSALGEVVERMRHEWRGDAFPIEEARFLAAWLEIGEGAATVAVGLLKGSEEIYAKGRSRLTEAASRSIALRHSFAFWTADKLGLICDGMWERSVFRVLQNKGLPASYVALLASTGTTELWSSQATLVNSGLLDERKPFVINLPTGAGKSLLAEMVATKELLGSASAWGVYLVPSRALVHQVEADLRRRLPLIGISVRTVIAGAEPGGILDEEVEELATPRTLTILTPEKLDVYFRNRPDLFEACRLLIVDEAHKLGDPQRGSLVDSLLTRFRLLVPEARLLLLSAVVSNVLEIASWLEHPEGGFRDSWRPTRQLKGLAVRHVLSDEIVMRSVHRRPRRERQVTYEGGVILAQRAAELAREDGKSTSERVIMGLFSGEQRSWRKKDGSSARKGSSTTDYAVGLATSFAQLQGVVVVFLSQKASAEKCARDIAKQLSPVPQAGPILQALVEHLIALLGAQHELPRLVRQGVAYHHADLPTPVRRALEAALSQGIVRLVCATSTLQEGMNTPATTVIAAGEQRWDSEQNGWKAMSQADFANIAGRAGRAGRDTEGQVIFLPSDISEWPEAKRKGGQYLFPPASAFVVQSALRAIEEELEKAAIVDKAASLSPAAQVMLLALQAAGLTSEDELLRFFSSSLATHQLSRPAGPMAAIARAYLARAEEEHGQEKLDRYAKTALPLTDCETLDEALQSLIDSGYHLSNGLQVDGRIAIDRIAPLIEAVFTVPRLKPTKLDVDTVSDVLAKWMNGATYTELATLEPFDGKVEKVVSFLGAAGNDLAWGLGAAYLLLDLLAPNRLHPELGLLPLYVEFGVNQAPAAYLSLLGVSEREAANALSQTFIQQVRDGEEVSAWQTFEDVEKWMQALTARDVRMIGGPGTFRARMLLEDLGLRAEDVEGNEVDTLRSTVELLPSMAASDLSPVGELCEFVRSTDYPDAIEAFGQMTGQLWGYVNNAARLEGFASGSLNQVFGVAIRHRAQREMLDVELWRRSDDR